MANKKEPIVRCEWCGDDPLYVEYHDKEWGREVHTGNEQALFEFLILEGAQAGLSWITVLRKREEYRRAFEGFDPQAVAHFTDEDAESRLSGEYGIVRNRLKVKSAVTNARLFLEIQREFGSFDRYIRSFLPNGRRIVNHPLRLSDVPASTPVSDAISADMKRRGFKFFGSTICYAFLQAVGYVDDHVEGCAFKPISSI